MVESRNRAGAGLRYRFGVAAAEGEGAGPLFLGSEWQAPLDLRVLCQLSRLGFPARRRGRSECNPDRGSGQNLRSGRERRRSLLERGQRRLALAKEPPKRI